MNKRDTGDWEAMEASEGVAEEISDLSYQCSLAGPEIVNTTDL